MAQVILVIGFGNPLRGDDAAGRQVAHQIEERQLDNVRCIAVQQLTPELAELVAASELAIFVDARHGNDGDSVESAILSPDQTASTAAHTSSPAGLLSLACGLFQKIPPAWLITIPGINFELEECLSEVAQAGIFAAVEDILNLIHSNIPKRDT